MDKVIDNINLKFNCPANWDAMRQVEGGRFCDHCQKKVYDFTDARQEVFRQILAENGGNICGRFRPEQVNSATGKLPLWKQWLSAAMVLIGITAFNHKVKAQHIKLNQAKTVSAADSTAILGMFHAEEFEPKFPGGIKAFELFLSKNMRLTKGMKDGRVFASFIIDKHGSVTHIKILRGLSPLNDNEVIRVLQLSPKWIPAKSENKPVESEYNIPIRFDSGKTK